MRTIILMLFLIFTKSIYSQKINYEETILKAKKTTIVCGKDKTEPSFDITVTLKENVVTMEIYGYGQFSKYKFSLDSTIKETKVFSTQSKLYSVTFIDLEETNKSYSTECSISNDSKKYYMQLKLPDSDGCVSTFELIPKKKK